MSAGIVDSASAEGGASRQPGSSAKSWRTFLQRLLPRRRRKRPETAPLSLESLEPRVVFALSTPPDQLVPTDRTVVGLVSGGFNADAHTDIAALDDQGKLHVALGNADGSRTVLAPQDLGVLHPQGIVAGLFNDDGFADLLIVGDDGLTLAVGDGDGRFTISQTVAFPTSGVLAGSAPRPNAATVGLFNDDANLDVAVIVPGSGAVWLLTGNGQGGLTSAGTVSVGGTPTAIASGNFVGDARLDLAVGRGDGSVAFLTGGAGGSFAASPTSTVLLGATVQGLATLDADGDGDLDLAATTSSQAYVLTNADDPVPTPVIVDGDFSQALTGWTTTGRVSATGGAAELREGASLLSSLEQTFTLPAQATTLTFDLNGWKIESGLGLGPDDAFEVSLLDANGNSLVPTWRPEATSFFNIGAGNATHAASGVTFNGRTVTLDLTALASVAAGQQVRLVFDLIGLPQGATSLAIVDNVRVNPEIVRDATFGVVTLPGTLTAGAGVAAANVSGDGKIDLVVADGARLAVYENSSTGFTRSDYDLTPYGSGARYVVAAPVAAGNAVAQVAVSLASPTGVLVHGGVALDATAPTVQLVGTTAGSLAPTATLTLQFSEAMRNDGTAAHSASRPGAYTLRSAGADGLFGTGDDSLVATTVSYDAATHRTTLTVAAPLAPGLYRVLVDGSAATGLVDLAWNPLGDGLGATPEFSVVAVPTGPTLGSVADVSGAEGAAVSLSTTVNVPPGGNAASYTASIDWGDGSAVETVAVAFVAGAWTIAGSHRYRDDGEYQAVVRVNDPASNQGDQKTATVAITNVAPTLTAASDKTATQNAGASFTLASFSDPAWAETYTATVNWGDGSGVQSATVNATPGSAGTPTTGTLSGSHTYTTPGTYTVVVTLTDGDSAPVSTTLHVVVEAPEVGLGSGPNVVPVITGVLRDDGASPTDHETSDRTLVIVGTASPNAVVTVSEVGVGVLGTTTADETGRWSFDYTNTTLATGTHQFTASAAPLGPLGIAGQFSLFVFDDLTTQNYTSVAGRVAVGGNADITAYGLGQSLSSGTAGDALVVGGHLNFSNSQVYQGSVVYGGSATVGSNATIANGTLRQETVVDFAAVRTFLTNQSTTWAALPANGTTLYQYGGLTLTGTDAAFNVFNVPASQLASTWGVTINVPAGSTVLVNVTGGTSAQMQYFGINLNGASADKLVWNFSSQTALTLQGISVPGVVLAPHAAVTFNNGQVQGTLIAQSFTGSGSFQPGALNFTGSPKVSQPFSVNVVGPALAPGKFQVVDAVSGEVHRYGDSGTAFGGVSVGAGNELRGVVTNATNGKMWVLDSTGKIFAYDGDGSLRGSWSVSGLSSPSDLALVGDDLWVVDSGSDRAYRFAGAATWLSGTHAATSSFALNGANTNATGLAARDGLLWVVDDGAASDQVFVYSQSGELQGSWTIDAANAAPTGITVDPAGGSDVWIVDYTDAAVYRYTSATGLRSGAATAASSFNLAAGNAHPGGISDPVGAIALDEIYGDALDVAGAVDVWTFTGSVGQAVYFNGLGSNQTLVDGNGDPLGLYGFEYQLVAPSGAVVAGNSFDYASPTLLLENGVYELRVSSPDAIGSYQFRLETAPVSAPVAIDLDEVVAGELTAPHQIDLYELTAAAGQRVYLERQAAFPGDYEAGYFQYTILTPSGATLAGDASDAAGGLTLSEAGVHRIYVWHAYDAGGSYQFQVWDAPLSAVVALDLDDVVSGEFTTPGQLDRYEFAATAGQRVYVEGDAATSSGGSFVYRIVAPSGEIVAEQSFFTRDGVTLSESGVYQIQLAAHGDAGVYEFKLWNVPVAPVLPLTLDQTTMGDVTVPGQLDRYEFTATAGQRVAFTGVATGGDPYSLVYAIVGPSGEIVRSSSFTETGEGFVLPEAGVYQVLISHDGQTGPYEFTLWDSPLSPVVPIEIGDEFGGEFTTPGQLDRYEFTGVAGQAVLLQTAAGTAIYPNFQIYDAAGDVLDWQNDVLFLPASGVYRIEVVSFWELGEYSLELIGIPADAPVALVPDQVVDGAFTGPSVKTYTFAGAAGQEVVFDLQSVVRTGGSFSTPRWQLIGPPTEDDPTGVLWDSFLQSDRSVVLPASGQYTLRIVSSNAWTGTYRFQYLPPAAAPAIEIAFGEPVAGDFLAAGQEQNYVFELPADGLVYFDVQVGFRNFHTGQGGDWRLTDATGQVVFSGSLSDRGPLALTAGEYTLAVSGDGPDGYAFDVWNLGAPAAEPLTLGDVISGALELPDLNHTYTFAVQAGQRLSLDANTAGIFALGLTFTLRDADGDVVYAGQTSDRAEFALETGEYTLELTRQGADFSNPYHYSFQLSAADAPLASAIEIEQAVPVSFATAADWGVFTFQGAAGQTLVPAANFPATFQLVGPDGQPVPRVGTDWTLPTAGEYTLLVLPDVAGAYSFTLWNQRAATSEAIELGEPIVAHTQVAGQIRDYVFSATAGQKVYFDVPDGVGGYGYQLLGPDGQPVAASLPGDSFLTFPATGEYTLRVRALQFGDRELAFAFRLVPETVVLNAAVGQPVIGSMQIASQTIEYTFAWAAGQELYLDRLRIDANGQPDVQPSGLGDVRPPAGFNFTLVGPDGATLFSTATNDRDDRALIPSQTGVYRLIVERVAVEASDYSTPEFFGFQLLNLSAPTTGGNDSRGTDFWTAFPGQMPFSLFGASGPLEISIYIAGGATAAHGTVTVPGYQFGASFSVGAGEVVEVKLPAEYVFIPLGGMTQGVDLGIGEGLSNLGVHITADAEVSVVGSNRMPFTGDAFSALPTDVLGTEYVVPAYRNQRPFTGSHVAVIATENDTTVAIVYGPEAGDRAGQLFEFTLNRGQTYLFHNGGDLTGSYLVGDKPFAVVAGHEITNVPSTAFAAGNYLIEQIPPLSTWGRSFTAVPFGGRDGDVLRILAGDDATEVRIGGALVATLARGQYYQTTLTAATAVETAGRALVVQFANSYQVDGRVGDPTMVLVAANDQFATAHTLVSIDSTAYTDHWITVVAPTAAVGQVSLDGAAIAVADFTAVGTSGYSAARIQVEAGTHTVSSPLAVATYAYGWGPADAYGYLGSVTLTPDVVEASLVLAPGAQHHFVAQTHVATASLRDDQNQPIAGAVVTFTVAGPNATTGTATTNALGLAVFTYQGLYEGLDVVTAEASAGPVALTATSTVDWGLLAPTIDVDPSPAGLSTGSHFVFTGVAHSENPGGRIVQVLVNGVTVDALDATGRFWIDVDQTFDGVFDVVALDSYGAEGFRRAAVPSAAPTDFSGAGTAVSSPTELVYSGTTYNRATGTLFADVRLHNTATVSLLGPVAAAFGNVTPGVSLTNEDRTLADGREAIVFDGELSDGRELLAGETSDSVLLAFEASGGERFSYTVELLAAPNTAPRFTTSPPLSAGVGVPFQYAAQAVDPSGDPLTYRLDLAPAGMTIDSATGALAWTPTAGQTGSWQITLVASDGRGGEATQSFTLTVATTLLNRPPVFVTTPIVTAETGATYEYVPSVSDADGDAVVFTLDDAPAGMTVDAATGRITYANAATGNHLVILRAADGNGGVATQRFVLSVGVPSSNPGAPVVTSTPPVSAVVDQVWAYRPTAVDPQGGTLGFTLADGPAGMTVNATTGQLLWTPTAEDVGSHAVSLLVSDGLGGLTEQRFLLEVRDLAENRAPAISTAPVLVATPGELYAYGVLAADPDGDPLHYQVVAGPAGLSVSAEGVVSWSVPANAPLGPQRVLLRVHDGLGGETFQDFYIGVRAANAAPVFTSTAPTTVVAGTTYRYDADATDSADAVSYSLVSAPTGARIDSRTGVVVWATGATPLGPQTLVIAATDERGLATQQTVSINVVPDVSAPSVAIGAPDRLVEGETTFVRVLASDDVRVVSATLTINGEPVALDSGRVGSFTATEPGVYTLVATATDAAGNTTTVTQRLVVSDPDDQTAPVVELAVPPSGGTITYLTDVLGSVSDENLASWRLEYSLLGTDQWTTIASGTSSVATASLLGVFDPTMLNNDAYVVRLVAEDVSENVASTEIVLDVQGQAKIGQFAMSFTDLSIPLAGIPITITRSYSTLNAGVSGDFGYGWSLGAVDPRIRETVPLGASEPEVGGLFGAVAGLERGDRIYLTGPDGKRVGFTFEPEFDEQASGYLGAIYRPKFVADPGVHLTLTTDSLPLTEGPDGQFRITLFGFLYNPDEYTLTTTDGLAYRYSQFDGLKSITDRNGNSLTFTDAGIFSSTGEHIDFVRDAAGRITEIIDPAGNALIYVYDEAGDLREFHTQSDVTSLYSYSADQPHFMVENREGCGCYPSLRVEYDDAGRAVRQIDSLGNITSLDYDLDDQTESKQDALGFVTTYHYDQRGNVTSMTDPLGATTTYAYDADDNVTSQTDALGRTTTYAYDARGNVLQIVDAAGGVWTRTYNAANKVLAATNAAGTTQVYDYDSSENLIRYVDAAGQEKTFTYDAQGRLLTSTDAAGVTTTYAYGDANAPVTTTYADGSTIHTGFNDLLLPTQLVDENGHSFFIGFTDDGHPLNVVDALGNTVVYGYTNGLLTSLVAAEGRTIQLEYDSSQRVVRKADASSADTTKTYDAVGRVVSLTDANGTPTTYAYDAAGRMESKTLAGATTFYAYDLVGNLVGMTDALGRTTTYTYDALNRLTTQTDALGGTTSYVYDSLSNVVSMTSALGATTAYTYDDLNRRSSVTDALGGVTMYTYDVHGDVLSVTDALGRETTSTYDARYRLTSVVDAEGGVATFSYDAAGNVLSTTDAHGRTTSYAYDAMNRVVSIVDALAGETSYVYDPFGNVASMTDALGRTTTYEYDAVNRMTSLTDAAGGETTYSYDAVGNLLTTTDALGRTTTYAYDAFNRLTSTVDAAGGATSYVYNLVGDLISTTDALGRTTSYVYDALDRLVSTTDAVGGVWSYAYDAVGNLISATDALGRETAYDYDALNRLTSRVNALDGVTTYAYDAVGNLTSIVDVLGRQTTYDYDDLNRLTTTTDALGGVWAHSYDAVGNLTSSTDALGRETAYTYDALDRLTGTTDALGGDWTYDYDAVGNLVAETDALGRITSYVYDALDRETSRTDALGGVTSFEYDAVGNLTSIADALGRQTDYAYDALDRLTTVTDALNGVWSYDYDAVGNLTSSTDALGRTTSRVYDSLNRLTTTTDALGGVWTYDYDAVGNLTSTTDALGRDTLYAYDALDRLTTTTDALDGVWSYGYDAAGNLTSFVDALGRTTSYGYDALNRRTSVADALGGATFYGYDAVGNLTSLTDALDCTTAYGYDALDRQTSRTDALGGVTVYDYDAVGNLTQFTDALGRETLYQYDDLNRRTVTTDALGGVWSVGYDAVANITSTTDALGRTTSYAYDALDRLTAITDALGGVWSTGYDAVGNVTSSTDALGRITAYGYDALDRRITQTDPAGFAVAFDYDSVGNLTTYTDQSGAATAFAYDALDRLTTTTDALGGVSSSTYDAVGNRLTATDPLNRTTTFGYDALDRRTSTTDALGGVTSQAFDAVGELIAFTDANGNTTTYDYDALGRVVAETNALGAARTFDYDAVGNLTSKTDRNGRTTTYRYDALDRQTDEQWWEDGDAVNDVEYEYDAVGNLLSAGDAYSRYSFAYDDLDRTTSVDNVGTPGAPHVLLNYAYDAVGNVVETSDNLGAAVHSAYDARDLLTQRAWDLPGGVANDFEIDFAHDARGMTQAIERYSQGGAHLVGSTLFDYDDLGRLVELTHRSPLDAALVNYAYDFDAAGQLVSESHHGQTTNYAHDATGQLVSADNAGTSTDESYAYDENGNRITSGGSAVVVGADNRLLSDGQFTYGYDGEGNLTSKTTIATGEVAHYSYDHRNRLTAVVTTSAGGIILSEASYAYDAFDRLILRTMDADGAGTEIAATTHTVYNGQHAWADFSSGDVAARWLYGDQVDQLLARWTPSAGVVFHLTDHLGTVRDLVDATGSVINHLDYDSFGRILSQTNAAVGDRFAFTGREWDATANLYYYRARWYSPNTGRFVSQDPLSFAAGDANLYRYVANRPLIATDPSGLLAVTEGAVQDEESAKRQAELNRQTKETLEDLLEEIVTQQDVDDLVRNGPKWMKNPIVKGILGAALVGFVALQVTLPTLPQHGGPGLGDPDPNKDPEPSQEPDDAPTDDEEPWDPPILPPPPSKTPGPKKADPQPPQPPTAEDEAKDPPEPATPEPPTPATPEPASPEPTPGGIPEETPGWSTVKETPGSAEGPQAPYKFESKGISYSSEVTRNPDGSISILHYATKDGVRQLIGLSEITKDGRLTNAFEVPEEFQQLDLSRRMYAEAQRIGFKSTAGQYHPSSANYKEFYKAYDASKGNKVEALYQTPAGKVAKESGMTPTEIYVGVDKIEVVWVKE